jgi:geranylgeranyl pyrophosphate synthase
LAGDYLLARSSELAAESLGLESVKLLASTYAQLVEGQTKEVQFSFDTNHGTDDYLKIIEGKTASLIKTSAKLGAMASGCKEETINSISKWAWHSGIIFQITDDILDLSSDEKTLGKPSGNDIIEGTYTLPVLIALEKYPEKINKILSDISENKVGVNEVINEFNNDEIISESKLFLKTHLEKSESAAKDIDNKTVRNILLDINTYLIERSN